MHYSATFADKNGPYVHRRTHEEDIYEDLCYVTLRIGKESLEEEVPSILDSTPLENRDYCIRELVETEKNYVDALNMIIRHFVRPLKKLLDPKDKKVIFNHIKELAEIHTGFHRDLCRSAVPHGEHGNRISNCFITWKGRFVLYGDYCANLPRAQGLIDQLCTKNNLILEAVSRHEMEANDGKFKLRDLLSLPMQRILKYHLFLKELIKNTSESHEDYYGLQQAYEAMIDIGDYMNEVKRDSETLQIIAGIQVNIIDFELPENTQLKDYGRLLRDGEVKIKLNDDKCLKNCYVFVFDKVMLMCKSLKGEQFSFIEALILEDFSVDESPSVSGSHSTGTIKHFKDKWTHSWMLVHNQARYTYTFHVKSEDLKRKWIEAIEKALDDVNPVSYRSIPTDHIFTMFTFPQPQECGHCVKLLPGLFFQGYKCKICGISVHKSCIPLVKSCSELTLPPGPPPVPLASCSLSVASTTYSGEEEPYPPETKWLEGELLRTGVEGLLFPVDNSSKVQAISHCNQQSRSSESFDDSTTSTNTTTSTLTSSNPALGCNHHHQHNPNHNHRLSSCNKTHNNNIESISSNNNEEGILVNNHLHPENVTNHHHHPNHRPQNSNNNNENNSLFPNYVNLNLEDHPWFAGTMDRATAQSLLEKLPNSTFLLRISPNQRGNHAISLNCNGIVKHMKICKTPEGQYYLSESKFFDTIEDLVHWYQERTLAESFSGLNLTLRIPYKSILTSAPCIGYAVALYSFTGNSANLLSLRRGDYIAILSKTGSEKGWWKGQIGPRVGYFPFAYVNEIKE